MTITTDKIPKEKLNKYKSMLCREWFFSPDGIHGIIHINRVLIYILLLSQELRLQERDTDLLCYCAIYHDIGRSNDYVDENHGIESHKKLIKLALLMPENEEDKKILKFIIENHCQNDKTSIKIIDDYKICDTKRAVKLFKIFKDCDALDRVRVNMLDAGFLRFEQSKKYIPFAWDIFNNPYKIEDII